MKFTLADKISILRVILIILAILMLYFGDNLIKLSSAILIVLGFLLDWVDGWIARRFKQERPIGSMIDVIADRLSEYLLWIFYLGMGVIPIWAPLIVIPRGVLTDFIRSQATAKGISVYELPKSRIAKFLVKSRFMRGLIGLSKLCLFTVLAMELGGLNLGVSYALVVLVVILNVLRGLPVILEAKTILS